MQPNGAEARYAAALTAEIAAHSWDWNPQTLYIGGGTPSGIDAAEFGAIVRGIPSPGAWPEATIEAAPGSFDERKIQAWQRAGINRVSLGVQSFVKAELVRTGRRHDASIVERDVAMLRAAGIGNISIDLIAGLPGQTEASWRASLTAVAALGVPHASVYMLEVDDDSRLGSEILLGGKRYGAMDVPSEDRVAEFYEVAACELARTGLERYEISNFAVPGLRSLHNLKYWDREPYVGFGADAHSFDGVVRKQNAETVAEYIERFERGESFCVEETPSDPVEEKFFVGLRLMDGITVDARDRARFEAPIERGLAAGVLEFAGDRLRLTTRGIMVSNEIFQEFIGT